MNGSAKEVHIRLFSEENGSIQYEIYTEIENREDGTTPDMCWPWPWNDSCNTDNSYCFVKGKLKCFEWGAPCDEKSEWPQMDSDNFSAGAGDKRSGTLVINL